jgi:nucleoside-triphosphatase THEP1
MTETLQAKFLKASNNLKLSPLSEPKDVKRFGVDYDTTTLSELKLFIENNSTNNKIILSGHTGCGKSTLLANLAEDCQKQFFVSLFSISDTIENSDVNYVNILFCIGLKLLESAERNNLGISPSIKEDLVSWFAKKTKTQLEQARAETGVGVSLLEWLFLKLKTDVTFRTEIKNEYTPKISELVTKLNEITAIIETVSNKRVLVIIDDIDKLKTEIIDDTFSRHIKSLFLPNFCVIYTLPITTLHDGNILPTLQTETNDNIVKMRVMKIYNKGETRKEKKERVPKEENLKKLKEILRLRLDLDRESYLANPNSESELIDEEAITQAVLYSGGVLRELIRIANECCRVCLLDLRQTPDKVVKIDLDIVETAVNNLRIQAARTLGKDRYKILQQIYKNYAPDDPQDPDFFVLLKGLAVIEYRDKREWFDLHPIVFDLLREWENTYENS